MLKKLLIVAALLFPVCGCTKPATTPYKISTYNILQEGDEDGKAKIVIAAPKTGEVGELIRLDVTGSKAQSFKWILVPESVDFEVYDEGRRAVFSARTAGKYMFIVACASEGSVDVATHTVVIGNSPDNPPPPPTPELTAQIVGWCADAKVSKDEAKSLASSFRSVASSIAAGVNTTPEDITKATSDANRAALGDALDSWIPVLKQIQGVLRAAAESGKLQTASQHQEMWTAIAEALEAYAN